MKQIKCSEMVPNRTDTHREAAWKWYQNAYAVMATSPGEWFELHNDTDFHAYQGSGRIAFDAMAKFHNPFLWEVRYPAIGHGVIYGRLRRGPIWAWSLLIKKESK